MADEKMKLKDGRGRDVWFAPAEVQAVKSIPTKYGDRLLLVLRDSGSEIWLDDTPEARDMLELAA